MAATMASAPSLLRRTATEPLRRALPAREWAAVSAWLSTFYAFQILWLLDWAPHSLLVKARQIGASHTYAAACALWALLGETTIVVSINEDDALKLLETVEKHLRVLAALGSVLARPAGREYRSGGTLRTASGGEVVARSSTNAGRSRTGNVVLDEFAYHIDPERVWDAAGAVTTHGGRLRVLSTPNGVGNLFHRLCTDPSLRKGWALHRVSIDAARADGLPVDEAKCWEIARGDPRVFDQLYRCSFLDADEQYIPTELVRLCSRDATAQPRGPVYAGLDVGLKNDLTALVILRVAPEMMAPTRRPPLLAPPPGRMPAPRVLSDDEVEDEAAGPAPLEEVPVRWVQETITWKRTSWEAQEKALDQVFDGWPIARLCIDATGLGAVPAERLVARYGKRVEAVSFTAPVKEELATLLYTHFAEKRVRLPSHDAALRDDVCALRRLVTAAGNIRYDAARSAAGHADRAWALALALHACSRPITRRDLGALPQQ